MKISVSDFFRPVHLSEEFSDEDYQRTLPYIHFAEALSAITYQSIYLIDYYKRGFLYVSSNPIFLCGLKPESVLKDGYLFYLKNVPTEDLEMLLKINEAGFSFFGKILMEDRLKFAISYDFHLIQPGGKHTLVNHKLKPLLLDKHGNPWIALCIVSVSANTKSGNVRFKSVKLNKSFELNLSTNEWTQVKTIKLTKGEREVLILSAQGLTSEEIAERSFLTLAAIKFRKRSIFNKLNVNNMSEAITISMNLALL